MYISGSCPLSTSRPTPPSHSPASAISIDPKAPSSLQPAHKIFHFGALCLQNSNSLVAECLCTLPCQSLSLQFQSKLCKCSLFSFSKSLKRLSNFSPHFSILTPVSLPPVFGREVATTLQHPYSSNPPPPLPPPFLAIPLHACLCLPIIPVTVRTACL